MSSRTPLTRTLLDCLLIGSVAAASLIAAVTLTARAPGGTEPVAVLFAPWIDGAEAMSRAVSAGARFVRFGGAGFLVVVSPEDESFRSNVHANGALMLVDPRWVGGCVTGQAVRS